MTPDARHRLVAAIVALIAPWAALAAEPALAPSSALSCLSPPLEQRGTPDYPEDLYKRKDGGTVHVELKFTAPDKPPKVKRLGNEPVNSDLIDAVEAYAERLRLPCLGAGDAPVTLRQEYVFIPNDGRKVVSSTPTDLADADRRTQLACLTRQEGGAKPDYPASALRRGSEGNVFLRMRFTAPDQAPQVTVHATVQDAALRREVADFVAGYRLPCLKDAALDVDFLFKFKIMGSARTVLKDVTLISLLRGVKDYPKPAFFDLDAMGCPFDVRLTYRRPHVPNLIQELESTNPARRAFLDWLTLITLALSESVNNQVLGDTMTVHVPCGKIDL